ncbi:anaerobic ribonucleoside-triphosphate reductase activating protein [Flavobacterium alvei]|uniref:anaerobic ribonucleoside-triphosphate reductase activating protein n=1 Tax=Flavobacterium alvei TaxID=2080416 RepID=UPI0026EA2481|nr:anaerobic ribonucleoside-triphosphate reductase activating protein [Flavobacterium alvei]HQF47209.1 anaerobic ribonucleoside-triphosphate reductase activating protein [Flavobacterium alvei]
MNTNNELILPKVSVSTPIYSLTSFTLLDYPHKSACILWFAGCNMRCLYCYNPEIVLGKGSLSFEEILKFLHTRKNLLDAVVFSGGECLLHKNIISFITEVKKMGFLVKIDTNGSSPDIVQKLLNKGLLDYIALDYKGPKSKFKAITKSNLYDTFEKTFDLILQAKIPFEVRTTYHSELLLEEDLKEMIRFLESKNYSGNYYIQYFKNDVETLSKLERSNNRIDAEKLSTNTIQIVLRE